MGREVVWFLKFPLYFPKSLNLSTHLPHFEPSLGGFNLSWPSCIRPAGCRAAARPLPPLVHSQASPHTPEVAPSVKIERRLRWLYYSFHYWPGHTYITYITNFSIVGWSVSYVALCYCLAVVNGYSFLSIQKPEEDDFQEKYVLLKNLEWHLISSLDNHFI